MKKEFDKFRTALMFFTRIPVGKIDFSQEHLNKSNKYLPIIGWIVGGVSGLSFWAFNFIFNHNYVRDDQTVKSKPIGKEISRSELGFASVTALLPFFLFEQLGFALIIPAILLIKHIFARYTNKWIGGYTGDLLGALQQITETSFYVLIILYIHFQN